ncbi:MAG: ankyrin repeat domain-containing protein [Eudoraea sp.]|nr:ankyrin repeat domain-containing protein [Eudoraea sp.]
MKRKHFIKAATGTGIVLAAAPFLSFQLQEDAPFDKAMVKEFVGASHGRIDKVKEMLEEHPTLLNVAHDWKNGDFETGLGAASHVGHKELVQHFLDKGAQANIFTACLFGKIDIVKPMITAFPNAINALGPHGFTLLHHAVKGGDDAAEVKEYLESKGARELKRQVFS